MIKFVFIDNCFSDLSTVVQIWYWKHLKFDLGPVFRKKKGVRFLATFWDVVKICPNNSNFLLILGKETIADRRS